MKKAAFLALTGALALGAPQPAQAFEPLSMLSAAGALIGLISNVTSMAERWGNNAPKYNEPRYADLSVPRYGLGRCDVNNILPDDNKRPAMQCTVNTAEGHRPLWFNVSQAQTQQTPMQMAYNSGCDMNNVQLDVNGQQAVYCSDGNWRVLVQR